MVLLGGNVTAAFDAQRQAEPHGPLVSIALSKPQQRGTFPLLGAHGVVSV